MIRQRQNHTYTCPSAGDIFRSFHPFTFDPFALLELDFRSNSGSCSEPSLPPNTLIIIINDSMGVHEVKMCLTRSKNGRTGRVRVGVLSLSSAAFAFRWHITYERRLFLGLANAIAVADIYCSKRVHFLLVDFKL